MKYKIFVSCIVIKQMDGWMTCKFMSFSTVFQSYQDEAWVTIKGCVQGNPVYGFKDLCLMCGLNLGP